MRKAGWVIVVLLFCATAIWIVMRNRSMKQISLGYQETLLSGIRPATEEIPDHVMADLPTPVIRYLEYALNGQNRIDRVAEYRQAGWIQINIDSCFYNNTVWKYLIAENTVRLDPPAFYWQALIHLGWEFWRKGWLLLSSEKQELYWTWMGAVPVMQRDEPQIKKYSLGLFLLQLPWYPTALVSTDYLQWTAIDDTSAAATLTAYDMKVTAEFHFDAEGKIVRAVTKDMDRMTDSGFIEEARMAKYVKYHETAGYRLPERIFFFWKTPVGWFSDSDFRLDEIVYR